MIQKKRAGTALTYEWKHDGDVVEVATEDAAKLLPIIDAGFSEVALDDNGDPHGLAEMADLIAAEEARRQRADEDRLATEAAINAQRQPSAAADLAQALAGTAVTNVGRTKAEKTKP
jgi:hypothetical protein